jgi:hypothetical protein
MESNKSMKYATTFKKKKKICYNESMYSMFKDKLQNCSLNQFE